MNFSDYLLGLRGSLSRVKKLILQELWGGDEDPFPRPWVSSSSLLELTKQKYFDRRIRELRDEYGCDIETGNNDGDHSYRLLSAELKSANPRNYLTQTEKDTLFRRHNHTCQICGRRLAAGVRGLQADHKRPLIRGGSHSADNWQPICNECNVGKRGACEGCLDDCSNCPWAYPEVVGRVVLVRLPPELLSRVNAVCGNNQSRVEAAIIEAVKRCGLY